MGLKARNLYLIYAISFVDLLAIGLTVPLFSNHLRNLGASHFVVGLIGSIYSGLQVLSGPVVGGWSDVKGKKAVLVATLGICCVSYLFLGVVTSLLVIAGLRVLLGVTKHTQSICKALITDLLPVNERAEAFSQSMAYSQLGFIIGPVLGGHLSEFSNGFAYVCGTTSLLFILNIGLTLWVDIAKSFRIQEKASKKNFLMQSISELSQIQWAKLWDVFLLRFIFGVSMTMYFTQQSVYLHEYYELTQRHIGYIISYFSASGTIGAFILPAITKKYYKDDTSCYTRLQHFFLLMTFSAICLYAAPNIEMFLVLLVPFSFSCTVLRIVSMELMLKQANKDHTGSLSGSSNSVMSIARMVTPVTTGAITDLVGSHTAMLLTSIPPLLGVVLVFNFQSKNINKIKTK